MPQLADILDWPALYRLWQLPFVRAKLRPLLEHTDLRAADRVLDVGCGPGTNSQLFRHSNYLGLDLNEKYIEAARRRYPGQYEVADVRDYEPTDESTFDLILINSFLHHIDDENSSGILSRMHSLLSNNGHIHVMELVLPPARSIGRWLAHRDRGDFPRSLAHWQQLFLDHFTLVSWKPYQLECLGLGLWQMVYFKGRRKDG